MAPRKSVATAVMAAVVVQREPSWRRLEFGIVERCRQVAGKSPHPQTGEPVQSNVSTPVGFRPAAQSQGAGLRGTASHPWIEVNSLTANGLERFRHPSPSIRKMALSSG
jgi:hypothetical protein